LRLAVALQAEGVRVTVLTPAAEGLDAETVIEGVTVKRYRYAPRSWETLAYSGTMASQAAGPKGLAALAGLVAAGAFAMRHTIAHDRPDVVHAHWWFPGGLSALGGAGNRPLVTTMHGSDVRLAKGKSSAVALMRRVLRRSAVVSAVSDYLAGEVAAMSAGQVVEVAPMPIDLDLFTPMSEPAERARFLFVGRLNAQKGAADLLTAFAAADPSATLDIVGDGEDAAALRARATSLGVNDRITWHGMRPQSELPPLFRRATALVVPSEKEGLGLVAVEAACCDTPTIGYKGGGLPDVVQEGTTGWLVEPGDTAALGRAMSAVIAAPDERNRRGMAAARAMRERFDPAVAACRYRDVYRRAITRA
jgi:glycosyltransferase involved in cell wall biosynthesis